MATLTSVALGVSPDEFDRRGVFDSFVDLDSALHVDPHLLTASAAPEFAQAYTTFQKHFVEVMKLVLHSRAPNDALARAAVKHLTFPELPGVGLGHSRDRANGNAIGPILAARLVTTAQEIVKAGIEDPAIFELAGLVEDNIGPDRISDMTLHIIVEHVAVYTARIAAELKLEVEPFTVRAKTLHLPPHPHPAARKRYPIFLLPQDVLRDIPVSLSWDDQDVVGAYSADLRDRVNHTIGETWAQAVQLPKEELRRFLIRDHELISDLLARYKEKPAEAYDFSDDPLAEARRYLAAVTLANRFPLALSPGGKVNDEEAHAIVLNICRHFRRLVEDCGLNDLLVSKSGRRIPEKAAQRLFFGIADSYCRANNLDLSPESNAGRGPIDFKISQGLVKVGVEVKLSDNRRLMRGWTTQLPIYATAEATTSTVYLIIRIKDDSSQLELVRESRREAIESGQRVAELVEVDARPRLSASKA